MSLTYQLLLAATPVHDTASTMLGDTRLDERHRHILEKMSLAPGASIPETFQNDAQTQAYYRFTQNQRFSHHDLLAPHFQATAQRARQLDHVHVIHDTTSIRFAVHDDFERENLCRFGKTSQGFDWHCSLVCAPGSLRAPLGLIASFPFVSKSKIQGQAHDFWQERGGVLDNQMARWLECVERAEARLSGCARVTHVMDREGDCFELLYAMQVSGYDGIIRACYNRRLKTDQQAESLKLNEALEGAPWLGERVIDLSKRPASKATKQNPARGKRRAKVQVRAVQVELARPQGVVSAGESNQSVRCWAVEMLELKPPKGEAPARWVLLTTHEVSDVNQAFEVVDGYQGRWLIEEYNKALKTGCGIQKAQQRSADALLKTLALAAPVAWYLLVLRYLSEQDAKIGAEQVLDKLELGLLRQMRPKQLKGKRKPKVKDVMLALASLGGHISRNGPPGWMTIEKGRRKLAERVEGARLFMRMTDTCDAS